MEDFLKGAGLERLCETLGEKLTVSESLDLLDEGRPVLLERLKAVGVSRIPDRQAFAKAVASHVREEANAMPVLVCMYSAGVTKATGRQLMDRLLKAASDKGFTDQVCITSMPVLRLSLGLTFLTSLFR